MIIYEYILYMVDYLSYDLISFIRIDLCAYAIIFCSKYIEYILN